MSHIVKVESKVHDPRAVAAACQRLNLPAPREGTAKLFSGEATGLLVQLPGWHYPTVIDTLTGTIRFDNFGGHWGEQEHMEKFLQSYAVEKTRIEAKRQGYQITERLLTDGSIQLQIVQAAGG